MLTEYLIIFLTLGFPAGFIFLGFYIITHGKKPLLCILSGIITLFLTSYILCFYGLSNNDVIIAIEDPKQGQSIDGNWIEVTGRVSHPGARVLVLVHPTKDLWWWVQPEAKVVGKAWKCEANLGTSEEGSQECFQIMAVASCSPLILDVIQKRYDPNSISYHRPPSFQTSQIITVWRKE